MKRARTSSHTGAARKKHVKHEAGAAFYQHGYRGPEVKVLSLQYPYTGAAYTSPLQMNFVPGGRILSVPLNCPLRGSSNNQRIGNKIRMSSCHLKLSVRPFIAGTDPVTADCTTPAIAVASATAAVDRLRLILFYDRQPNAAVPLPSDLLQDVGKLPAAIVTNIYSGMNMTNSERFLILRDEWLDSMAFSSNFQADASLAVAMSNNFHRSAGPKLDAYGFNCFIKLKGLETQFINNADAANVGNTFAEISTGSLCLLAISENYDQFIISGSVRVKYTDL